VFGIELSNVGAEQLPLHTRVRFLFTHHHHLLEGAAIAGGTGLVGAVAAVGVAGYELYEHHKHRMLHACPFLLGLKLPCFRRAGDAAAAAANDAKPEHGI